MILWIEVDASNRGSPFHVYQSTLSTRHALSGVESCLSHAVSDLSHVRGSERSRTEPQNLDSVTAE
jgi:hypothetical protein